MDTCDDDGGCFQGVEFFDEKLNALFMAWLLDHGMKPLLAFIFINCEPVSCKWILLLVSAGLNGWFT